LSQTENWFKIQLMWKHDGVASPAARPGYTKSLDTRARILAAALEEASDSGLHKASVARIAARAGVAIGNLHYHFGSRAGLLRELLGSLVADLMSRLHAVDADDGSDFFDRQQAGLLVYLDYLRANPAYVRLADEIKLYDPGLYRRAVAGWVDRMAARIRVGIQQGALRPMADGEITAQAHFLLGARHFLEQMVEGVDGLEDEAVVDAYVALLRGGLGRQLVSQRGTTRRSGRAAGPRRSRTRAAIGRRTSTSRSTSKKGK
jgi:AcrR family transcriptional regulator